MRAWIREMFLNRREARAELIIRNMMGIAGTRKSHRAWVDIVTNPRSMVQYANPMSLAMLALRPCKGSVVSRGITQSEARNYVSVETRSISASPSLMTTRFIACYLLLHYLSSQYQSISRSSSCVVKASDGHVSMAVELASAHFRLLIHPKKPSWQLKSQIIENHSRLTVTGQML